MLQYQNNCTGFDNHNWVRYIKMAFDNLNSLRDIKGGLSLERLIEFLQLYLRRLNDQWTGINIYGNMRQVAPLQNRLTEPSSMLQSFSNPGSEWKSWALSKCKLFIWLAVKNKCWTADRLARSLSHPDNCVLCD